MPCISQMKEMEGGECHTVLWQASQQHSTNINSTLRKPGYPFINGSGRLKKK